MCSPAAVAVIEEGEEVVMRREAPDQTRFGRAWERVRRGEAALRVVVVYAAVWRCRKGDGGLVVVVHARSG